MVTYFLTGPKTESQAPGIESARFGLPPGTSGTPGSQNKYVIPESPKVMPGLQMTQRDSFHELQETANNRPSSVHLSRENINQMVGPTGAVMRNRLTSEDSPKLAKASMTPPNSLGRKRKSSGGLPAKETTRKPSSSSLTSFLLPPVDPNQNRVASPDLPVFHYCNTAIQGSGSLGKNDNTGPINTLTQSQILNPGIKNLENSNGSGQSSQNGSPARSSRTVSRSSNDSVVFVPKQSEPQRVSPLVAHSEPNISSANNGKVRPSPTSSHGNINMCAKQQQPFLPGIQESLAEHKQMQSGSETRSEYDGESDCVSSRKDSLTNSEIVAINSIMSEIGHPEQGVRKKGQPRRRTIPDMAAKNRLRNGRGPSIPNGPLPYGVPTRQTYEAPREDDALLPPVCISTIPVKNAPKVSLPLLPKQNSLPDTRVYMIQKAPSQPDRNRRSHSNSPIKSSSLPHNTNNANGNLNKERESSQSQNSSVNTVTPPMIINDLSGGARPKEIKRAPSGERNISPTLSLSSSSSDDSPPPLPPPPPDDLLELPPRSEAAVTPPFPNLSSLSFHKPTTSATSEAVRALFAQLNMPTPLHLKNSAFAPLHNQPPVISPTKKSHGNHLLAPAASNAPRNGPSHPRRRDNRGGRNLDQSKRGSSGSQHTPRHQAPPFQVKRRQPFRTPQRLCRSLDYIPSDLDEAASVASSRGQSPDNNTKYPEGLNSESFMPINALIKSHLLPDNISLSSVGSSEMSRSDPALNYDSGSTAYESEYDNYRPGMASDEDYFVPEPISDIDLDMFDDIDINIDNVTVSDAYAMDMPMPKMQKKITEV